MDSTDAPSPAAADAVDEDASTLDGLLRFTSLCLGLGIPADRVVADFRGGLEDLRQRGSLSVQEMAGVRARAAEGVKDNEQWAEGFVPGYLSGWAAAALRVMEARGLEASKEMRRAVVTSPDAGFLSSLLDCAATATHRGELVGVFTAYAAERAAGR
ncbi:hypothetical protein [Streptomyces sp. NPDC056160]|uniref:hypothetical protein n=1 Tax=Streptomyces sp. NPDC056160 TaxID=3345731 RepID=UPI0035DB27B9